jgi:serine/threonine protein kinase/tetratricopeptide (TPR) repeat protein
MATDDGVIELLLRWEEAKNRGQRITPEELCRTCPELLEEVSRRIQALQSLDGKLNPPGAARPPPSPAASVGRQQNSSFLPGRQSSDRNLLFGILALQMDFICRDMLVEAMHAWVLDKSKPLGQILADRGALSSNRLLLLEALVEEHRKQHGGDPEKSLAALSSVGSLRKDLAEIVDPDLEASLAHVSRDRAADDYSTISWVGAPTSSGLRFRIVRPHAKGGLGEVFVAQDEELHREVALKQIQDRHADNPHSRSRFLLEAEITGGLEHPSIVPVYGLGQYADGRPFYAMRFIRGDSLKEAIQRFHQPDGKAPEGERTLEFRKLLGRFVDVCNAIAYAHSRGVLHRDLKPGNVMLGKYGETLVVDWGLAKSVGERAKEKEGAERPEEATLRPRAANGSAPTVMGTALGTPAFMSPEQAAGRLDQLGPASDVYSLGATLYTILTGHAPYEGSTGASTLQRVQKGDFPRPRLVNRQVSPPLEAVCLKAMALRPDDRYPSVRALADDIEHWLADEPVLARREPYWDRARRWRRRHRTLVTAVAVALLVSLVGLVATAQKERTLRLDADQQRDIALQERERAEQAEQVAKINETKAKQSAEESRAVLDFLQHRMLAAARPKEEEGGLGIDATIRAAVDAAEPSIAQAFQSQPIVEASIRSTLADTYSHLGEWASAIKQYARALMLREATSGVNKEETLCSLDKLARAYQDSGQVPKAVSLYEDLVSRAKASVGDDDPVTLEHKRSLALAYLDALRLKEGVELLESVLATSKRKLGADDPATLTTMNYLAGAYYRAGERAKGIALFEETGKRRKKILGPEHDNTLSVMNNLALVYRETGHLSEAVSLLEELFKIYKRKLGSNHIDTLAVMNNLALAYKDVDRLADAIALSEASVNTSKAKFGPEHPETLISMNVLGNLYRQVGRADEAALLLEETLKIRRRKFPEAVRTLMSMCNLGRVYYEARRLTDARLLYEEALKPMRTKLGATHTETLKATTALSAVYIAQRRFTEAEVLLQAPLGLLKQSRRKTPLIEAELEFSLGRCLLLEQKTDAAIPLLRKCLATREQNEPDAWPTFEVRSLLGGALGVQQKYSEAESLLLAGYQGMIDRESKIPVTDRARIIEAGERVVQLYDAWGKKEKADEWRKKLHRWRRC